jgi:Xaa-Pro aminopeptidase
MSLINEKIAQASGILREAGVDCWLTFVRETGMNGDPVMPFLAPGHVTWQSAFIVTASGRALAIVGQYDKRTVEETGAYEKVEGYVQSVKAPLQETLKQLNPKTIAINYSEVSEVCDGLTHGMFLRLEGYLKEIGFETRLVQADRVISALRARKTATEVGRIKEAIRRSEAIFDAVGGFLAPGRSERDVAEFVASKLAEGGLERAWEAPTCPAVFTGPDSAGAHYTPTERHVERGHLVNMDFGVKCDDYCADLQRTWYLLREGETAAPPEVQRGFDTIVRCIEESRQAMAPGVLGKTVDAVSRRVVTDAGYEEFPHAVGHQVGRYAHDGTALLGPEWEKYGTRGLVPLEKGMIFTIEPRLTVPGYGIATVEEMVVVTDTGAEFLSNAQTTLRVIGG